MSLDKIDLSSYSLEDLIEHKESLEAEIEGRKNTARSELIAEFEEKARSLGLDLSSLIGKKSKGARAKVAPKYRSDLNASDTWSGRGRKPKWLEERLEAGIELDSLLIE